MNTSELLRRKFGYILGGILFLTGMAYAVAHQKPIFAIVCLMLPFVGIFIIKTYQNPVVLLFSILIYSFLLVVVGEYFQVESSGLALDILLVFSYVLLFVRGISYKIPWYKARNPLVGMISLWMLYVFLELFNPQAPSKEAWFYVMRGMALYMWLFIPLGLILLGKPAHLNKFIIIWGVFVILASLWGFRQLYFGLNETETRMMRAGLMKTHLIWGKLRVFSFYTDAGQFGAAQAHAAITACLMFLGEKNKTMKLFLLAVGAAGIYGMFISGTRGAMFIPVGAVMLYLFVIKNIRMLVIVGMMAGGAFIFLKYTNIGNGVYAISRMRSAFDPEDASFQVRLDNQRLFREYLSTRPFGGGVGTTGAFGERFSPDTFLAKVPTDSGYVQVWAECGIVGLVLYLFMWLWIVYKGLTIIWYKLKDPWLKNTMTAFVCGVAGMLVANYGNAIITQVPSSFVLYTIIVFIFISPELEKQLNNDA